MFNEKVEYEEYKDEVFLKVNNTDKIENKENCYFKLPIDLDMKNYPNMTIEEAKNEVIEYVNSRIGNIGLPIEFIFNII